MTRMNKHDKLTPNFTLAEFFSSSRDGRWKDLPPPSDVIDNLRLVAAHLELIRAECNRQWGGQHHECKILITRSGGWRSAEHNARQDGAPKSYHLRGLAADIKCKAGSLYMSSAKLAALIERMIKRGELDDGGLGVYPGFVHVDLGPARRW